MGSSSSPNTPYDEEGKDSSHSESHRGSTKSSQVPDMVQGRRVVGFQSSSLEVQLLSM
jgi:hypothetical protein